MTPSSSNGPRTVSVVIPTHNNMRLLTQCLQALQQLTYPRELVEFLVADNASTDGTAETLRARFPDVKRIDMGKNSGFAPACNRGASEASGDYVAFLNDDALAEPGWLEGLFAALDAGGEATVCAGSHIRSRTGSEIEFAGASANLFGVGRPRPVWGWADSLDLPREGSPILFASGGAMLIHRRTFLDAGGFDPDFFAYFEDVDLGWRLWLLGHRVVYAPNSVVRHMGGATGSRLGAHRRYTLWECNSLAVIVKNYESGHMERLLSAALMLLYKRALLSGGEAIDPAEYRLGVGKDTNEANVERLPKISVAHLAAINRFNRLLPHFMEERGRIQAQRKRSDREILPLLGRAFEPQFAGSEYAEAARHLARALDLYGIANGAVPSRVALIAGPGEEDEAWSLARGLGTTGSAQVAVAIVGAGGDASAAIQEGMAVHSLRPDDPALVGLLEQADALVVFPAASRLDVLARATTPIALVGEQGPVQVPAAWRIFSPGDPALVEFCLRP